MSEKKQKQINIPLYELKGQVEFLYSVCLDFKFDYDKLLSLIFADWICKFQKSCQVTSPYNAFLSFLNTANETKEFLLKVKKEIENEPKNKS